MTTLILMLVWNFLDAWAIPAREVVFANAEGDIAHVIVHGDIAQAIANARRAYAVARMHGCRRQPGHVALAASQNVTVTWLCIDMREARLPGYAELHLHLNGRVTIAVEGLPYKLALRKRDYAELGLAQAHDHMTY